MRLRLLLLSLLALALSSCTVYLRSGDLTISFKTRFGVELSPVITRFDPDRGTGGVYRVGESISFIISLTQPGYITLVGIDPDGRTYEFDRMFLREGTHVLSGPPGQRYLLTPPVGTERVRAVYTNTPPSTTVGFNAVYKDDGWDRQIALFFEQSRSQIRDVAETYFYIYR